MGYMSKRVLLGVLRKISLVLILDLCINEITFEQRDAILLSTILGKLSLDNDNRYCAEGCDVKMWA